MNKDEFLQFLRDPDICKEIFEIVKKGGKPVSDPPKFSSIADKLKHMYPQPKPQPAPQTPKLVVEPSKIPPPPKAAKPQSLSSVADKLKFLRGHIEKVEEERFAAEVAAKFTDTPRPAENFTVVIQKHCPICENDTRVVKPKARLNVEKRDTDYCVHYKDFNPYIYTIFVCEHCGFAAEEKKFTGAWPNKIKESLREFLKQNDMKLPFVEERTAEDALSFFEMAILFSELTDHSKGRQAILNLNAAWMCRCEGLADKEHEFMKQAAENFATAIDNERWPINGITLETAMYLCAAIHFMIGDMDKATSWLSKIMNNASLRTTAPKLFEQARDMWQDIKRAAKA